MLRCDRFLGCPGRWIDLATGRRVTLRRSRRGAATPLFGRRGRLTLIDVAADVRGALHAWEADLRGRPPRDAAARVAGVVAALDEARLGRPRLVTPDDGRRLGGWAWRLAAREARARGWVPAHLTVLAGMSQAERETLAGRTLAVFVAGVPERSEMAALDWLAASGPQPHLVVRDTAAPGPSRRPRGARLAAQPGRVDAARGPAAEAARRWRVIRAAVAGDADLHARACLSLAAWLAGRRRLFESRAEMARLPLAGESDGARRRVERLILRESMAGAARALGAGAGREQGAMVEDFVGVLEICRDVEDEQAALSRVGAFLCDRLQASSAAFVVRAAGQPRVVAFAGRGHDALGSALRAIDSGVAVPARQSCGPAEMAHPVRQAADVIGAVWCRWSSGIPIAMGPAAALLEVAATAIGPSLRTVAERDRVAAGGHDGRMPEIVGTSEAIGAVRAAVARAASSPFPVLVEGESGAGKELVARAIHRLGVRPYAAFEAVNCAALAEDLVEAELFGHARGAFTGAVADRTGLFEAASGGTLFLDEVAELGPRVQAKLLRVLQEGEVRRLGEAIVRQVDTRIVSATNRPLASEVEAGRFRKDLRFRLDVIRIHVPPLRERAEDLPAIIAHAWRRLAARTGSRAALGPAAVAALARHDWPGNVRELQNVLATVMVAAPPRGLVGAAAVVAAMPGAGSGPAPGPSLEAARHAFERRYVGAALARHGWRVAPAARELGLTRQGLAKVVARLGLVAAARTDM
ncbi:MAG: sigma 54-interacting transcriptional regulator [Vicinamibacterales bacterium]